MSDGTSRYLGSRALAEAIAGAASHFGDKRGFAGSALIADWQAVVGDRLAVECMPERLSFPPKRRKGGTLTLRIAHGGIALELQHLQHQLIERINGYLGWDAVARIRFVHGPIGDSSPKRPVETPDADVVDLDAATRANLNDILSTVDDPDLRAMLESLGKAVFSTPIPTSVGAVSRGPESGRKS